MQNKGSSWNWIVALILALILLWMLFTGRGASCNCGAPAAAPAASTEEIAPAVTEAFHFTASASEFNSTGSLPAAWAGKAEALKGMLSGDIKAEGGDKHVTLTGTVESDAAKQQKGKDAEAFFGPDVTLDNQLMVKLAEPIVSAAPPPAAKLYFDTGKTILKDDANTLLVPIVDWLKTNANAKAVISGFHDPRGNQATNELLAKNRAKAVREALKAAGVDEARIELHKPQSVDGGADLAEARRVEVSVE